VSLVVRNELNSSHSGLSSWHTFIIARIGGASSLVNSRRSKLTNRSVGHETEPPGAASIVMAQAKGTASSARNPKAAVARDEAKLSVLIRHWAKT
jgi:hypothetical protein